jgi:hypothetical protein
LQTAALLEVDGIFLTFRAGFFSAFSVCLGNHLAGEICRDALSKFYASRPGRGRLCAIHQPTTCSAARRYYASAASPH